MAVQITENDHGTIKAHVTFSGMNIDEVQIEAEYDVGDPGDRDTGAMPSTCEINRVFIEITKTYGEQNLDMTRLSKEVREWEQEIIDAVENDNEE